MRPRPLLLATLLVTLLGGCADARTNPTTPPAPSEAAATTAAGTLGAASGDLDEDDETAPQVPGWDPTQQAAALARAEGFVRAWARPDLDATTWLSGVRGFATASAIEGFMWTDPALIPATTLTGPAVLEGDPSGTSATVRVPTDAGDQLVLMIHSDPDTPWLAASLTPADNRQAQP